MGAITTRQPKGAKHVNHFPFQKRWPGALPLTCFVTAYLIKLDQRLPSMDAMVQYFIEHPELAWVLGFL